MAIVWYYRVGVALGFGVYRYAFQGGSSDSTPFWAALNGHWTEFLDPEIDTLTFADTLSAELPEGTYAAVSDHEAPFELRKLSVRYNRTPTTGTEDVDVTTHSFLRIVGGEPSNDWSDAAATYQVVESAFDTFFNAVKGDWKSHLTVASYRWHKDGPAWRGEPTPYNPAVRVTAKNIVGASGSSTCLPPQDAMTVTLKTSSRPSWGRFYLPAWATNAVDGEGRFASGFVNGVQPLVVTCLNACRAAGLIPVVFAPALPQRDKHSHGQVVGQLPARVATAYEVTGVQIDNIVDVVRRRRYQQPGARTTTLLT